MIASALTAAWVYALLACFSREEWPTFYLLALLGCALALSAQVL